MGIERQNNLMYSNIRHRLDKWLQVKAYLKKGTTLTEVAQFIGVNRTYLSNYINDTYRASFNEWLNALRIDEAKAIIKEYNSINLTEVALRAGFKDLSHFSKMFKLKEHISPSVWRRQTYTWAKKPDAD